MQVYWVRCVFRYNTGFRNHYKSLTKETLHYRILRLIQFILHHLYTFSLRDFNNIIWNAPYIFSRRPWLAQRCKRAINNLWGSMCADSCCYSGESHNSLMTIHPSTYWIQYVCCVLLCRITNIIRSLNKFHISKI